MSMMVYYKLFAKLQLEATAQPGVEPRQHLHKGYSTQKSVIEPPPGQACRMDSYAATAAVACS